MPDNSPELWRADFPRLKPDGHKYDRGHALVYGGRVMTGAARLAARAAQRIGAGLVTLAAPEFAVAIYATALESVIVRAVNTPDEWRNLLEFSKCDVVVIGPGMGRGEEIRSPLTPTPLPPFQEIGGEGLCRSGVENCFQHKRGGSPSPLLEGERGWGEGDLVAVKRDLVLEAVATKKPCVLDADALTVFEDAPEVLLDALHENCALTPHEGEFKRLFGGSAGSDKITRASAAARRAGCVVLLKGAETVIAAPDGAVVVNRNAPPWLATAGAGDVLAGIIAGLLAQRMPIFPAASAGAWIHGRIATQHGPGLIAEDIVAGIPAVLREGFGA